MFEGEVDLFEHHARVVVREGVEVVVLKGPEAYAEIAPGLGNNCLAFRGRHAVLEELPFDDFLRNTGGRGIPILFPFPNRIRDGVFTVDGERFEVEPPARHGLVRDKQWQIVELGADADGAFVRSSLRAADCVAILGQFPFPFRIEVTYRLAGTALEMSTVIRNEGERMLPYGFGIHPYFRKPRRGTLTIPASRRWELESFLPTGSLLEADGRFDLRPGADLQGLELDDIYTGLAAGDGGRVTCTLDDLEAGVRTVISFDGRLFPHVVAYTPPREALCIEPQTCPTDAFNLEARKIPASVRYLAPGGEDVLRLRIEEQVL